jgi:hypothetical protein
VNTNDDIEFEIPYLAAATELCERLPLRHSRLESREDAWAVCAALGVPPEQLAKVLRDVAAWVHERSLGAIRFSLDGRWYVLEGREAAASVAAA